MAARRTGVSGGPRKSCASLAPIITTTTWGLCRLEVRRQLGRPVEVVGPGEARALPPVERRVDHAGPREVRLQRATHVEPDGVAHDQARAAGLAAVGCLGLGGTVVVVAGTPSCLVGAGPLRPGLVGTRPRGDEPHRAAGLAVRASRGRHDARRAAGARLSVATGPMMSRLTVRRLPTGETCALCCSVGANSRNHTAKASTPSSRTRVHGSRTRPSGGPLPSSAVTQIAPGSSSGRTSAEPEPKDRTRSRCREVGVQSIRTGSR